MLKSFWVTFGGQMSYMFETNQTWQVEFHFFSGTASAGQMAFQAGQVTRRNFGSWNVHASAGQTWRRRAVRL
jgi:hypothetical protein